MTTTDLAGNSFTSSTITVLVDHTAPVTTATPSPASPSNAPVTVTFTADDGTGSGVAQTSYRVDGGSTLTGTLVVISAPGDHSNDGSHTVEFFSTDDVGNVESTKSVTVVIDTTAPGGSTGDPGSYLRSIALLSYSTPDTDISLGPVPVHARRHEPLGRGRRRRRDAAVRGLLGHDARR